MTKNSPSASERTAAAEGAGATGRPPSVRQVYAIARALCTERDESWPRTSDEASALISRLRGE